MGDGCLDEPLLSVMLALFSSAMVNPKGASL